MKTLPVSFLRLLIAPATSLGLLLGLSQSAVAGPATVLFQDDFTGGIPGWTAVQPPGTYIDGPMLWEYNRVDDAFSEQSNIYTDSAAFSSTRTAVMLINGTVAPANFTYSARLTTGDDDGFGLIFGYQNDTTFYRVQFARQSDANRSTHWPFTGWNVDRMNDRQITDLFGASTSPTNANYLAFTNRAGVPFVVTITVANNRLTLTVVDDPAGTATAYSLVSDQPLPSSAAGRVGMFSWGMSAGTPRSFRIQNPVLSPTALAGDPAGTVLTNWSFLVTPRADGTTTLNTGGPMIWAQGLSVGGDRGTMIENGDNYHAPDNVAAGTTNFAAPTAVAGNVNWSNYVYSARFISSDNDGFGMLLRYQSETNFYRIALRNQNSTSGVKRGISIQKNVNLAFDQVFASTAFIPPTFTPIDMHASIRGNRLQLAIISNPLSAAAQMYYFGPFDITGGTVETGKVGVFSWAQYNEPTQTTSDAGTEVDFVRVSELAGEGLLVSSAFGTPDPPPGLNDLPVSSVVTAKVDSVVTDAPGVRRVLLGWEGAGSVPASGSTNEVMFTLNSFSMLNWKWQTEYQLSAVAAGGGTVTASHGPWVPAGTSVTVTATPNAGYRFTGWSGASAATVTNLSFGMSRPISLTANFAADSDGDGLPDSWEMTYFNNLDQGATDDPDHDGANNLTEYLRGTDPAFAETLVATDGLSSRWINEQRDPVLPGQLVVTNVGPGFRGVWENSNDNRYADDGTFVGTNFITAANFRVSFQGPLILVRSNFWAPAWGQAFTLQAEYSVGDDDGICLYFRYLNESNWFRVTVDGQTQSGASPVLGVSVQKRVDGYYSEVAADGGIWIDPLDTSAFKRVRVTVTANNDYFEVRVVGWDAVYLNPPDWSGERLLAFSDASLPTGRIGLGAWGMGAGSVATNGNPVSSGMFVDNLTVTVNGTNAFTEDWETARVSTDFPPGWSNPHAGAGGGSIEGDWQIMADGAIGQLNNNFGPAGSGTLASPKADVEGPVLLAPPLTNGNYVLNFGFHPFDDDGVGFVYDFADTNNFARVLFDAQAPAAGNLPQGLSLSRKSGGVWTDLVAGDPSFIYTPGRPFEVQFANNNGNYVLLAWNSDTPTQIHRWQWAGAPTGPTNRYGLATWASTDAHFTHARAYNLRNLVPDAPFKITGVSLSGGNVILDVSKPSGARYDVLRAAAVDGLYSTVAVNQASAQYFESAPAGTAFYKLQLVP